MNDKTQAASFSIASNTILTISKIVVGFVSGSVSTISEGLHSGIDLIASLISFVAIKNSGKPADKCHSYGHGKIENISGTIEALLIFIAAIVIICESAQKLYSIMNGGKYTLDTNLGIIVMAISAIMNFLVSTNSIRVAKKYDSIALMADAMHLRTDIYTSLGVFVGLILVKITGLVILDSLIALVIALAILKTSIDITKQAISPLLDRSLPEEELQIINEILISHTSEFIDFHKLRTRKAGAERHIDLHLVVSKFNNVGDAHRLCDDIEDAIKDRLAGVQILIHFEPCCKNNEKCIESQRFTVVCTKCNLDISNRGYENI